MEIQLCWRGRIDRGICSSLASLIEWISGSNGFLARCTRCAYDARTQPLDEVSMIEGGKQFQPELFRKYLRVLAQVALRSRGALQNKIDASDLVQSALLQAIEALPQFRGQTD